MARLPWQAFVHDDLDIKQDQIRLVKIDHNEPELGFLIQTFDHATCPPYEALSYEWGFTDGSSSIFLNGLPYVVSPNLWLFLHHFSDPDAFIYDDEDSSTTYFNHQAWLWIDQICINQTSELEKNHQVRRMSSIFKRAVQTIVWLGPEQPSSNTGMLVLSKAFGDDVCNSLSCETKDLSGREHDSHLCAFADGNEKLVTSVHEILSRPYWTRLWTVQEFVLAKNLVVFCGLCGVSWRAIERFYDCHAWVMIKRLSKSYGGMSENHLGLAKEHISTRRHAFKHPQDPKPSLRNALDRFGQLKCADKRDKVYGLLGIVNDDQMLEVDYFEPAHVTYLRAYLQVFQTTERQISSYWTTLEKVGREMDVSATDLAALSNLDEIQTSYGSEIVVMVLAETIDELRHEASTAFQSTLRRILSRALEERQQSLEEQQQQVLEEQRQQAREEQRRNLREEQRQRLREEERQRLREEQRQRLREELDWRALDPSKNESGVYEFPMAPSFGYHTYTTTWQR